MSLASHRSAMPPARPPGEAGVTLVELLVAATIIGIALIPLLQFVPAALAPAQVSESVLELNAAAMRKMEELITRLRANIGAAASGAEACSGVADCRLEWTIAVELSSVSPGVGSLVAVGVVACQDRNTPGVCEPADEQVVLSAKVTSRP